MLKYVALLGMSLAGMLTSPALAADADNGAKPWQLGFQEPASPVMERLDSLHTDLTITVTIITLFVLALLGYIVMRFRAEKNPNPSKTTHNTLLEIVWTVIPVLILVGIAIPSLKLHYFMDKAEEPEMTLKVIGYQWYWNYSYPDHGDFAFDSYMVQEKDLKPGEPRLLKTDNPVVVPVDTVIQVDITGGDVLHAWAMPGFGVKKDAVPGRLNSTWFKANRTGTFYGQCSELCGVKHGFMPIEVKVVSKEEFNAWTQIAKEQFAEHGTVNPQLALTQLEQTQ
jgi:cytochrome c oxidase subunit 2